MILKRKLRETLQTVFYGRAEENVDWKRRMSSFFPLFFPLYYYFFSLSARSKQASWADGNIIMGLEAGFLGRLCDGSFFFLVITVLV